MIRSVEFVLIESLASEIIHSYAHLGEDEKALRLVKQALFGNLNVYTFTFFQYKPNSESNLENQ